MTVGLPEAKERVDVPFDVERRHIRTIGVLARQRRSNIGSCILVVGLAIEA